jgi:hypothetical protein
MYMDLLLAEKTCLYDPINHETIIYGQYKNKFTTILIHNLTFSFKLCTSRPDFYIKIQGKPSTIETIVFTYEGANSIILKNIELYYPFEKCNLQLNPSSCIITTMCKDYQHRLDEWIQYNLKLGFSGIVIFNNDENKSNMIYESYDNSIRKESTEEICNKYKGRVWLVHFPYAPLRDESWTNVQRLTLDIGVNAFRKKCRNIALIDADEFIYLPANPSMKIEEFLKQYSTITMKSNILTNKNTNDILYNNILQLAKYVGEEKYTKTILHTAKIKENEFIITPHTHQTEQILQKEKIIHYHCWVNDRYLYNESMKQIDFLKI